MDDAENKDLRTRSRNLRGEESNYQEQKRQRHYNPRHSPSEKQSKN